MAANTELLLKKFLKRRVKITAALITAFMITGKIITATTLNNYEVKDAISTKNGNVKMTNLKTLEIESNENNNNVEYEKNINASNGTVNITTEEKISLKDAKTGIFASGKNSTVKLRSNKIEIITKDSGSSQKEHGFGLRAEEKAEINLQGKIINIEGNKINNKYFYKNGAILAANGGKINISCNQSVNIEGHRGIDTKAGAVNIESLGDIAILSNIEGIFSGRFGLEISNYKNEINLKSQNGNITIVSNRSSIYASNQTKENTSINLTAKNIYLKDVKNQGIVSFNADVNLKADETINIETPQKVLLAEGNSNIKKNKSNISLKSKNLILKSIEENNKTAVYSESHGKINLIADNINILGNISALKNSNIKIKKLSKENTGNVEIAFSNKEIDDYRKNDFIPSENNFTVISAENNSNINIDLKGKNKRNNGSLLIAQIKNNIGTDALGTITLNMDKDSIWVPRKSNSVTNLSLNGGTIDLASDKTAEVHIENLKGEGTFNLYINTANENLGNMLYIRNFIPENINQISENNLNLQDLDLENLTSDKKIRFATLGKGAKGKVTFKNTVIYERGIQNVGIKVKKENFNANDDENKKYKEHSIFKNEYNLDNYEDGENWYIMRENEKMPWIPLEPTYTSKTTEKNPPSENNPDFTLPKENLQIKVNKDNDITKSIIETSKANYSSAVYMDNLNKRLGDISFTNQTDGIWIRLRNDRIGEDNEYRLRDYITQIGYDKIYFIKKGIEHKGIAFNYAKGKMEYKNITGNSHIDKYIFSVYDTRFFNNDIYTDIVTRIGYMKSNFDIITSKEKYQVKGNYNNLILGISAEIGKKFLLSEKAYVEPQLQLQYTYIGDTDYTTNQGTNVELNNINSLIGRIGFRLGYDFYKENIKNNTIYLKADINSEMLGEQRVKASDITGSIDRKYKNNNTWTDFGIGAAKDFTEDLNLYIDIEKQVGEKKDSKSWEINAGFIYKF